MPDHSYFYNESVSAEADIKIPRFIMIDGRGLTLMDKDSDFCQRC